MNYPNIRFKIDFKKDIQTLRAFVRDAKYDGGRSLEWGIFRRHPRLRPLLRNRKRLPLGEIKKYVLRAYSGCGEIMKQNLVRYEKNWRVEERKFFELTDDLFGVSEWPKGKYIAYLTIWGMFPRFLDDKTFQIPFRHENKKYVNVIIAHEMLHFMFYDYFYKKYPRYRPSRHNFFVWHISEIFNVLVQNSPAWLRVFKEKTLVYPEHRAIIAGLKKKISGENLRADGLAKKILAAVRNAENLEIQV